MAKIYLNMDILKESTKKVEFLECFSFAMMIKMTFTSSLVKNATIRNLKSIFGIGTTKISRILKNSLQYNFVKYDNNGNLLALPLSVKEPGQYHYCFKYNHCIDKKNPKCPYKINTIMNELRSIILLNKINTKDNLLDQLNRIGDLNKISPKSRKDREKKLFLEKMSKMKCFCHFSINNMMDTLSCSRYAAIKAIKTLIAKKQVSKWINRQVIYDPIYDSVVMSDKEFEIARREHWELFGEIIIRTKNNVFIKLPNIYHCKSNKIVLFYKGTKSNNWNPVRNNIKKEKAIKRIFDNLDDFRKLKVEDYYDFDFSMF